MTVSIRICSRQYLVRIRGNVRGLARRREDHDEEHLVRLVPSGGLLSNFNDEDLAAISPARLLIAEATSCRVEMVAHRIHSASTRAQFPFVHTCARDFPVDPEAPRGICCTLLDAATVGSMFISDVEEVPLLVQGVLIVLLNELESGRGRAAAVRLMSGTTVSLLDRIAAGLFSERLFYELNIIHLLAAERTPLVQVS